MEEQRITAQEVEAVLQADVKVLAQKLADAINAAQAGRIIAESEEPVRDAHAVFRQQSYQHTLNLLQDKALQEAFSPSAHPTGADVAEQGAAEHLPPHRQRPGEVPADGVLERRRRDGGAAG